MRADPGNRVLEQYERLARLPGGKWLFARLVCMTAPYFATIRPRFHELRPGFAQVSLPQRRRVQNHLRGVHALAMGNLCELAAGLLMEVSVPAHLRWIPKGMQIQYVKQALTDVTATARLDKPVWRDKEDVVVPVSVMDTHEVEVVRAVINMYVSPKQKRRQVPAEDKVLEA